MKILNTPRRGGKTHDCVKLLVNDPNVWIVTCWPAAARAEVTSQGLTGADFQRAVSRIMSPEMARERLRGLAGVRIVIDNLPETLEALLGFPVEFATGTGIGFDHRAIPNWPM